MAGWLAWDHLNVFDLAPCSVHACMHACMYAGRHILPTSWPWQWIELHPCHKIVKWKPHPLSVVCACALPISRHNMSSYSASACSCTNLHCARAHSHALTYIRMRSKRARLPAIPWHALLSKKAASICHNYQIGFADRLEENR